MQNPLVKRYYAPVNITIPSGATDWTPFLANAATEPSIIDLSPGATYSPPTVLNIPKDCWVRGNKATVRSDNSIVLGYGVTLDNLYLIGSGRDRANLGLRCQPSTGGQTVRCVQVSGFSIGVELNYCWVSSWSGMKILDCAIGLNVDGNNVNAIHWTAGFISKTDTAVRVVGAGHKQFRFSTTVENNLRGICIQGEALDWLITSCYFESNGEADVIVDADTATATTIQNCVSMPGKPHPTQRHIWVKRGIRTTIGNNLPIGIQPYRVEPAAYGTLIACPSWVHSGGNPPKPVNLSKTTRYLTTGPVPVQTMPTT